MREQMRDARHPSVLTDEYGYQYSVIEVVSGMPFDLDLLGDRKFPEAKRIGLRQLVHQRKSPTVNGSLIYTNFMSKPGRVSSTPLHR